MSFHGDWIDTFLSTVPEVQAAGLVFVIFGMAAYVYPDSQDRLAVFAAVGVLLVVLGFVGPPIVLEWHYWLVGGALLALLILVIDTKRDP
jgi:hypothetical protein